MLTSIRRLHVYDTDNALKIVAELLVLILRTVGTPFATGSSHLLQGPGRPSEDRSFDCHRYHKGLDARKEVKLESPPLLGYVLGTKLESGMATSRVRV